MARRYVDEHPGTLALDIDVIAGLIGGWRDDFFAALGLARAHGWAMADLHLHNGYDVVLPQLVTSFDRGPAPEDVAREAGATYVEVALLLDDEEHDRRLSSKQPLNEVEARIQTSLQDPSGDLVLRIREQLTEYLAYRPDTLRLETTSLGEDATYNGILHLLATA